MTEILMGQQGSRVLPAAAQKARFVPLLQCQTTCHPRIPEAGTLLCAVQSTELRYIFKTCCQKCHWPHATDITAYSPVPSAGTSSTSFVHNLKPTQMLLSHLAAVAYLVACSFLHQTLRHNSNASVIVGGRCYFLTFQNFRICHFFFLLSFPLKV